VFTAGLNWPAGWYVIEASGGGALFPRCPADGMTVATARPRDHGVHRDRWGRERDRRVRLVLLLAPSRRQLEDGRVASVRIIGPDLKIVPGQAVLLAADAVSAEPVS
jgi:hypothetical protein